MRNDLGGPEDPGVAGSAPALTFEGQGRIAAPDARPAVSRLRLDATQFELAIGGAVPLIGSYRDIRSILPGPGSLLLILGEPGSPGETRVILEQLGARLAGLVAELRERRTRQRLADALVRLGTEPIPALEYRIGDEHGVAQLAVHDWGAELVPFDEALEARRIRRAAIGTVDVDGSAGLVRVGLSDLPGTVLELPGLGAAATAWGERLQALRDGAFRDAAALVAGLLPDAPYAVRQRLGGLLIDGRPASAHDLGPDLGLVDAAVLTEPVFAASFRELLARSDGTVRWFALAPARPGADERRAWYLVGLPGNLLALELVSEGAHATYLFRVAPRATYRGEPPGALPHRDAAAAEISAALIDARFLREPIALPAGQLANARYLRYRLALSALPTLAGARRRFVARLVHDDPARWASALDALIAWHGQARDEAAEWPGRAAQDAAAGESAAKEETSDAGL
jgi:hypothetical protein